MDLEVIFFAAAAPHSISTTSKTKQANKNTNKHPSADPKWPQQARPIQDPSNNKLAIPLDHIELTKGVVHQAECHAPGSKAPSRHCPPEFQLDLYWYTQTKGCRKNYHFSLQQFNYSKVAHHPVSIKRILLLQNRFTNRPETHHENHPSPEEKETKNKICKTINKREIICAYLCECWWFLACLQAPPPAVDLGYLKNPAADGRVRVHVSGAALLMQRSSDGATELSTDQGSLLSRDQGTLAPLEPLGRPLHPHPGLHDPRCWMISSGSHWTRCHQL